MAPKARKADFGQEPDTSTLRTDVSKDSDPYVILPA
jgi:hypothetical protein